MRILYVTAFYPPDFVSGATMQVQRMAVRTASAGHDVHVLSGTIASGLVDGEVRLEPIDGVTVHWLGSPSWTDPVHDVNWSNPVATDVAAALLDELRPDLVHAHTLQTLGGGPLAEAHDRGIRTIVTMHDLWWWCALLFLVDRELRPCPIVTDAGVCPCARDAAWRTARARSLRQVLDSVDEVLVPSATMRDLVVANGLDPAQVSVDANDIVVPDPASPSRRSAGGERGGPVRFAFLGGDHPLKGTEVLLAAARRLLDVPGWTLTMYGVEARSTLAGSPVSFQPAFDGPAALSGVLGTADAVIIASVARESFSLVAREALAAGLPVVTSDCFGPEEVVHDGVNGVVVPAGDDGALAAAMRGLIDDRRRFAALTDGARRSEIELRSPDEHAAALAQRYATAPSVARRTAPARVVHVVDRTDDDARLRAGHAAESLELHGVTTAQLDPVDPAWAAQAAGADVVILHVPPVTAALLKSLAQLRSAGTPLLWDSHRGSGWVAGARACDAVVAATVELAERGGELTGLPHAVVPHGVGIDDIRAADALVRRPHRSWRRWRRIRLRQPSGPGNDAARDARIVAASRRDALLHRGPHSTANAWLAAIDVARRSDLDGAAASG